MFAERHRLPARRISDEASEILLNYDWPGNVRELRNVIEGALVMADGVEICPCDLPTSLTTQRPLRAMSIMEQSADLPFVEARERALREFDRAFLAAALARNDGNIARTARALGLHRQSLQKLLARRDLRQPAEMQRVKRVQADAGEHSCVLVPCLVAQPRESDRTVKLGARLRLRGPLMRERQFLPLWHVHRATGSKLQQSAHASSRFSRLSPPGSR
jgi:transcriptional regulator with GAF, ATPase, and Fis domain